MLAVSATRVVPNAANTARTQRVKRKGAGKVRLERVSNASRVASIHSFIHFIRREEGCLSDDRGIDRARDRSRAR
jgi:hypothetical protein